MVLTNNKALWAQCNIYGPFREGPIAAADTFALKIAGFRVLIISLYQEENETATSIE